METHYVCKSCEFNVLEKDFKKGKNACTNDECERYGEKLEKRIYCKDCEIYMHEEESKEHVCDID